MAGENELQGGAFEQMPVSYPPAHSVRGRHAAQEAALSHGATSEESAASNSSALDESAEAKGMKSKTSEKAESDSKKKYGWARSLIEFVLILVAALAISVFIKTFFMQAFYVPSGSMESTLIKGDRIAVNRMARSADEIKRGDVIVFVDPGNWLDEQPDNRNAFQRAVSNGLQTVGLLPANTGHHLVKRVIGVGGDTVSCCSVNGKLMVNGVEIDETYVKPGVDPSLQEFEVTVPEGHLWVMGDNRSDSKDSRFHQSHEGNGFVPVENVVGRVWAVFYPFSRMETIPGATDVFADVK